MKRWSCALVLAATMLAGPRAAHAQPDPAPAPAPAAEPTPAPAKPSSAAPVISEQAKRHFNAGVTLLQDPEGEKVEEAYRHFRSAYELSGSPKILGNMGFCAMRLERDGEAVDAYSRYLREVADIDPDERAQIVRDLQTLGVGTARITLEVNVPGAMVIDERVPVRGARVTNPYGPITGKTTIGVRPGHHIFTAKLAGREDASWEVEAYAGAKDEHAFVLKEPARAAPAETAGGKSSNLGPVIVLAGGGALLVAGGITGMVALNKSSDIEKRCPNDRCGSGFDLDSARSSAQTFVSVTDLLLLLGGVAVLGGLYWGYRVWSAPESSTPPPPPAKAAKAPGFLHDWRLAL